MAKFCTGGSNGKRRGRELMKVDNLVMTGRVFRPSTMYKRGRRS